MTAVSRKAALRREMEETRLAFHALLDEIPDAALDRPSDNPAWTIRQVLYHMSLAPRLLGADVKLIVRQNWLVRLAPKLVPRRLFNWGNARLTRWQGGRKDRRQLAAEYDRAHASAVKALDGVTEAQLAMSLIYPDWDPLLAGEVTLERLFHYVRDHFEQHAAQIRGLVATADD
jgi:uncharacterized damage-inducible protein DinB